MTPPASYLVTVATEQVKSAGDEPARGWPAYSPLYPEGAAAEVIRDPVFNSENFRDLAADYGWVAGAAMDPLTAALKVAKAELVGPGEFRTLGANARFLRPLVGRGFQVWELKGRAARNGRARDDWRLGARLGPNASGIFSQMIFDLGAIPPGMRMAGFREVMEGLRSPAKVGYPPSVATDAQLGCSVAAYQSAEVRFERCEGGGRILVRVTGSRTRAHKGSQQGDIAQRAKGEYCLCCTRPAHIAVPSRYQVGEYSARKASGI